MDRYGLAREFELRKFEMHVMKMTDLYQDKKLQSGCLARHWLKDESMKSY